MNTKTLLAAYILILNLLALLLFGIDKAKAQRHAFRIPEAVLFEVALLGGSAGAILGMLLFRHKTKQWRFRIGLPFILVLQLLLVAIFVWRAGVIRFL